MGAVGNASRAAGDLRYTARRRGTAALCGLGKSHLRAFIFALSALYFDLSRDGALHRMPYLSCRCYAALFYTDTAHGGTRGHVWRLYQDPLADALATSCFRYRR